MFIIVISNFEWRQFEVYDGQPTSSSIGSLILQAGHVEVVRAGPVDGLG